MNVQRVIRIRSDGFVAEVVPDLGGALAAFYDDRGEGGRRDWLRPATAAALADGDPLRMASFVLLPWCNRLRGGRFVWNGQPVELSPATAQPHALHGVGWVLPWTVAEQDETRVRLTLQRDATPQWPFPFAAEQVYALDRSGLAITVALTNIGSSSMPAGIGHHPYFPHRRDDGGTRLQARVDAMWQGDSELLPTRLDPQAPAVMALSTGTVVSDHVLDNNFVGFGHEAVVTWPDGSRMTMRAESPLDCFVLYSPADTDHFCAEAVSNCTDWINLRAADPTAAVGGAVLRPGDTLRATTWFGPER